MKHFTSYNEPLEEVECLELIKNGESSDIAEKIIDYIERSLLRHELILTKEGKNHFSHLLGEISDNCREHGGEKAKWYTLGHYFFDKRTKKGKCQLVILDFGETIYEGLKNAETQNIRNKLQDYVNEAVEKFSITETEETLYTLFSLQQRVSRVEQDDGRARGNGTVTFLDAFQKLFNGNNSSKNKSMLSITSGKCSILFDGTYTLKEQTYENGQVNKIIAFNSENRLDMPPDKKYVRTLENFFPGTVISMELYIDDTLMRKEDGDEQQI